MNKVLISALTVMMAAAPAIAQTRDPAYAAARASGLIGEQPDGYLGIVGASTPDMQALVSSINIQRKSVYTKSATAEGGTVEQFAFVSGCNLILKTVPGEKYQTPNGGWQTRTAGPPERDPRCL